MTNYKGLHDISIDDYHNDSAVSKSGMSLFKRAPIHYWYRYLSGQHQDDVQSDLIKKTNAKDFGNALHTMILEPEEFLNRYAVYEVGARNTKAGKEAWAKTVEENQGKLIVDVSAYNILQDMLEAFERHSSARKLVNGGQIEQSIFWTDEKSKLPCKIRPDVWQDEYDFIVDFKTAQDASFDAFQRAIYTYGYYLQAGMMSICFKDFMQKEMKNFIFIAMEKEPPYAIAIYVLDETAIEQGVDDFNIYAEKMMKCFEKNDWPSYNTSTISLPAWASKHVEI